MLNRNIAIIVTKKPLSRRESQTNWFIKNKMSKEIELNFFVVFPNDLTWIKMQIT